MVRELDGCGEGGIRTREPFGYPLSKRAHSATMRPLPTRLARCARCDSSGPYRLAVRPFSPSATKVRTALWTHSSRQSRSSLVLLKNYQGGCHVVRRADRAD